MNCCEVEIGAILETNKLRLREVGEIACPKSDISESGGVALGP